jgi:hypothetical protein
MNQKVLYYEYDIHKKIDFIKYETIKIIKTIMYSTNNTKALTKCYIRRKTNKLKTLEILSNIN